MKVSVIKVTAFLLLLLVILSGCGAHPIENVRWVLVSYGDPETPYALLPDRELTARFDSETKEVGGSGGCNLYGGEYEIDGTSLTMKAGSFAVTEMWCGDTVDAQEKAYLDILLAAESYELNGDILRINCGDSVLYYERE